MQNQATVGAIMNPAELVRDLGFCEAPDGPLQQAWRRCSGGAQAQAQARQALEEALAMAAA